ncbi:bifunctional adenosylcobinamide kinase/adenosylcobinamide-phosphate guanylyltransferase [Comamonas sp. 26]|uniref:bifunctional adenosylcobinamide kinase/adenosylcobinamide-phosphate guanylyltransferase n=1 Tax=Comamonas sp. 26 TaxID=2035201 RepID=UPI000C1A38AC|nr:bifunctional adenosylcobinamide kinase/adenosylcobinamide-phosphate guanylyltransferase [Comamonas sp. 26]
MPRTQFILGGQKSGKSRRAELLARQWLQSGVQHQAVLVATGQAWDAEMTERIVRHQRDRAERVPGMQTLEEPRELAQVIAQHSHPERLLVIDCLTLWLTNWLMPVEAENSEEKMPSAQAWQAQLAMFLKALDDAAGPIILVGNEIGLGVIPMGREVRAFVDALGVLNQQVAAHCESATLMCAGLPLALKGPQA